MSFANARSVSTPGDHGQALIEEFQQLADMLRQFGYVTVPLSG